ncbi:MG2 domain-containing protein [Flavobacterium marginilacus]|uniref:alpha-2-macroglobulin family protein n=1 Tax=Flavobacterium marginilacus TaxID=3003256 RepID=UPI00248D7256|nr:MG2 domain-containing protein [Flavobacterium marginilacus]
MKNIYLVLLFVSTSLFAQQYEKDWNKVVKNENEGKIKTANEIVDKIHKKAYQGKNEVQLLKCFFYESRYLQKLEESAKTKIIKKLKIEIKNASIPSKAIYNLIYAKCLNEYYNQNRYYLKTRTQVDSLTDDFLIWSQNDFEKQIQITYDKTLENDAILKKTPLTDYEPIFDFSTLENFKKESLFNFLLKEYITFYKSKINQWEIRTNDFTNFKDAFFGNSDGFTTLNLDFIKNEPLKKILELYQKQESNAPTVDNQLERILFCETYILKSKEDLIRILNSLQKKAKDEILLQKIQFEKAKIYSSLASKEIHPDYNIKAISILDSIINIKNRSNSYKLAFQKKQELNSKTLAVQLQKFSYNNENTRALINYANVHKLQISFYKISKEMSKAFAFPQNRNKDDFTAFSIIKKNKPVKTIDVQLLNKKDYFSYSTEVLLPQLETGNYFVFFESDSYADAKAFAYETITISNLAVLAWQKENDEYYQVLDRKTGKPIENVSVQTPTFSIKTDKNGIAIYNNEKTKNEDYRSENLELMHEGDSILFYRNYIRKNTNYTEKDKRNTNNKVQFYLDRAIYRPGQNVFYKGIAIQKNILNETKVIANTSFKIIVKNRNQEIKSFVVTTNEFGSFSGEFDLPKNGLTGYFSIEAHKPDDYKKDIIYDKNKEEHPFWSYGDLNHSQISFRVEEYKRPKFEIIFDSQKEIFQVNQTIKVKGIAKAFAGSNISDSKVSYSITRQTDYPNNFYNKYENETIATGETKTDGLGKFNIEFVATPNANVIKEQFPVFYYRIVVKITDVNGETHSAESITKVGYYDLVLSAKVPKRIETDGNNQISVNSTNINGNFLPTKGEIKIYFVRAFSNKFKKRVFPKPEIETISNDDFERLFPFEENEKPLTEKDFGSLVFSKKIDTEKDKKLILDFITDYQSGNYKVVFSAKDTFDNLIENSADFQIIQSKDKFNPSQLLTIKQVNTNALKDGFALIKITSAIPELYLSVTGNYQRKLFFEENHLLQNGELLVKVPIKTEFEKSIKIGIQCLFDNQNFNSDIDIDLSKDELNLEFLVKSFRNKIEPGSNENWSFQLKAKNTAKEAEILASMYDSSLDQFAKQDWDNLNANYYNYGYYNYINFKTNLGFETANSFLRNLNQNSYPLNVQNEATSLMWFGFDINSAYNPSLYLEYLKQLEKKEKKPLNSKMISGIVSDKEGPLSGVTVFAKGKQVSATTDLDGYYEITANIGEVLTFIHVGYATKEVKITSKTITTQLKASSDNLYEAVVVDYGIQKKTYLTGVTSREVIEEDNSVHSLAGIQDDYKDRFTNILIKGANSTPGKEPLYVIDGEIADNIKNLKSSEVISIDVLKDEDIKKIYGEKGANGVIIITTKKALEALTQVKARKNLSETAFFYPNLKTDSKGNVSFNFTSPEALTAWKLRLLAHNKDAVSGYLEKTTITQKDLMVTPNFPRFFREKDSIVITTKVSNVTNEAKTGIAVLQLFDTTTMQAIDAKMNNTNTVKNFTIPAYGNTTVSWKIYIPEGLQGVQYKVLAKAGNFSDGEENILPVLTNNMLVTESIPIWVRGNSKKEYTFENLKNNNSSTLKNHQFTLEYTSNPTWLAIQSLPYLMEYEHECAEQIFARFYANALASEIISSNPKIAELFETWRKNGKLNSKLEENEELKSIILAETPWLNDAQNEDEKKKNLALLFDLEKMKTSQQAAFDKLKQKQKTSGGFPWFDGSDENEYITRHILAGLGHLAKLNSNDETIEKIDSISEKGIPFIDSKFLEYHKTRTKNLKKTDKLIWINPYSDLHYLYTRSFYLKDYPLNDTLKKATKLYLETAKKDWLNYSLYEKGMTALVLNRFGETSSAKKIIESLKETASNNEDWGMYWIANKPGWYWYQAPIETQALLIEAFAEVDNDTKSVDAMKVWLLKNKQTKNWPTTKSTTEAVYALLMQGTDWLSVKDNTFIKIGDEKILTKKLAGNEKEAETGYIKLSWKANEIKKEMASVSIQNKSTVPGFGGLYWQYFEDLDKIKNNSGTNLSVAKELYIKKNTDKGSELQKITAKNKLKIGDLVTVRLIISAKEDMEFVHLKDMRASCFEPVDVLSGYEYKGGLGFYRSTKDVATHFFFDQINKGTYILEYDIRVNNTGNFSNGISTIDSMYAPEYTSHTKGIRVNVKN